MIVRDDLQLNADNFLDPHNREALLQNRKSIRKKICGCITDHGFQPTGRSAFSLISEDLAAFVHVEHPSCMFYVWFCVYPLYMPPKEPWALIYGLRLSEILHDNDMNIRDYADETETAHWCTRTGRFIQDAFLPFTAQINTAQKLMCGLGAPALQPYPDLYRTLNANRAEIGMYAWLSQHAYDRSAASARAFLAEVESWHTREDIKAEARAKAQEVFDMCNMRDDRAVDKLLGQWRIQNAALNTKKSRAHAPGKEAINP